MKRIYIGSLNPVKINCVRQAFDQLFPSAKFEFVGKDVDSGVSDQPMSDHETYTGARNRALFLRNSEGDGHFWIGIEGGIEEFNESMHAYAWMVVLNRHIEGEARTATFQLPPRIVELIKQGVELGEADDQVFKRTNSKKKDGAVGILTHGVIDRMKYYHHAMVLALIPFLNKDLF